MFVANMTGNVVFLGFALAGASGLSTAASLVAIGAMLLGALAGGLLALNLSVAAAMAGVLGIVATVGLIIWILSRHDVAWAHA